MDGFISVKIDRAAERRGLCWRTLLCLLIGLLTIDYEAAIAFAEKQFAAAPTTSDSKSRNVPKSYAEAKKVLTQLWETHKPIWPDEQYDQLRVSFIGYIRYNLI